MRSHREVRFAAALILLLACCNANAEEIVLFGPVEHAGADQVTVLGHRVSFQVAVAHIGKLSRATIGPDTQALVVADIDPSGALIARDIRFSRASYIAGASDIYIGGTITSVDVAHAKISIGGTHIYLGDISDLRPGILRIGKQVSVVGKQPLPLGSVWATSVQEGHAFKLQERQTLTPNSITGTGIQKQSITGTGVQMQSITGTGVLKRSITGTGIQKQSITGTGVQMQSITGTGVLKRSITGTGIQKQSITGTGVQMQSITGTGVLKRSITGTGIQKQSITGTGVQMQSITGTGVLKRSITGTGVQEQSITGTGAQVQSITGTGLRKNALRESTYSPDLL